MAETISNHAMNFLNENLEGGFVNNEAGKTLVKYLICKGCYECKEWQYLMEYEDVMYEVITLCNMYLGTIGYFKKENVYEASFQCRMELSKQYDILTEIYCVDADDYIDDI